jgi:hypothetical protein
MPMSHEFVRHRLRGPVKTIVIIVLLVVFVSVGVYFVYAQYSMNLATKFVPIPTDAANLSAFYIGIGQGRTLYVRFDFIPGSEDKLLSELCGERNTDIVSQTNPFQHEKPEWWMPNWWLRPQNPETYLGGECYDRTIYKVLIDKTNEAVYTAYIRVSL